MAGEIVALDHPSCKSVATWRVAPDHADFSMALDEAAGRLYGVGHARRLQPASPVFMWVATAGLHLRRAPGRAGAILHSKARSRSEGSALYAPPQIERRYGHGDDRHRHADAGMLPPVNVHAAALGRIDDDDVGDATDDE